MRKAIVALALAAAVVLCTSAALAEVYRVSDLKELERLVGEVLNPGDVVEIEPGVHFLEVSRITFGRSGTSEAPIIIRGVMKDGARPVIDAEKVNVKRCIFYMGPGIHDIIVENLEMRNAWGSRYADRAEKFGINATAIFFDGSHNITVRNCESHHNEDGFFATRTSDYILIENCHIHHNGTLYKGTHNATHNFYFCARHQMVKNSYIHSTNEGENFKSRGENTIFAFNWVDEEAIYSIANDSGSARNTLWLGNVVMKRTVLGHGQGRLLGIGDGTGIAAGTVVAVNNTFITVFPRDFYLFTFRTSTGDFLSLNNVFAGPGRLFADHNGQGKIYGTNNWIADEPVNVPYALGAIRGEDPGFTDAKSFDFRPAAGSPLIDGGVSPEDYMAAIKMVTDNARGGTDVEPSETWLKALAEIEHPYPMYEPLLKGHGFQERKASGAVDIGAFEAAGE